MSGKKRRELQMLADQKRAQITASKRRRYFIAGAVLIAASIITFVFWPSAKNERSMTTKIASNDKWTLPTLLSLKPHQLADLDIALMNLLCAGGLRGSEMLDIDKSLARLDEMASLVRRDTDRHLYRFQSNPAEYQNSEPYFRIMMLVTVLQQDFGIRYNPARISPPENSESTEDFYASSKDVFIHGCTDDSRMGTCSSLPVLYTAVCRRLHYPVSLVSAKGHLFARWQDEQTHMNIEATSIGFASHDDEFYKKWPFPMTETEIAQSGYLKNMTAADELAAFLSIRAFCLFAAQRYDDSIANFEDAARIAPHDPKYPAILALVRSIIAKRLKPKPRGAGMPPDPSLWDDPPEIAWMLWEKQKAQRQQYRNLPNGMKDPTPFIPLPNQPGSFANPGLPSLPRTQ